MTECGNERPFGKWDVCLADVPFEDIPESKVRPVLILEDGVLAVDCFKMTGQPPRPGEYVLKKWKEAGLRKETTVRLSKRLELEVSAVRKRIGKLHPLDIVEIEKKISV